MDAHAATLGEGGDETSPVLCGNSSSARPSSTGLNQNSKRFPISFYFLSPCAPHSSSTQPANRTRPRSLLLIILPLRPCPFLSPVMKLLTISLALFPSDKKLSSSAAMKSEGEQDQGIGLWASTPRAAGLLSDLIEGHCDSIECCAVRVQAVLPDTYG